MGLKNPLLVRRGFDLSPFSVPVATCGARGSCGYKVRGLCQSSGIFVKDDRQGTSVSEVRVTARVLKGKLVAFTWCLDAGM